MDDRRLHIRKLSCIPAFFEAREESQDLALIRDVSVSGARLYTRVTLDPGSVVHLHLYLSGNSSPPRPVSGRVVRVDRRDPAVSDLWTWDIGVEFAAPITKYSDEIDALSERQVAAGILRR